MRSRRCIFFGTPPFAKEILRHLVGLGHSIEAVVTRPDAPQGRSQVMRPPAVKVFAEELGLTVLQPPKASDPLFWQQLKELQAELFIVVAYGQILKQGLLDIPPLGCLNIHASLLPLYRGAAPIQHALMAGEKVSGITIMQMTAGLDSGPILLQKSVPIPPDMTTQELADALCLLGKEALAEVLEHLEEIEPASQEDALATFAPKIAPQDAQIDWADTADVIHNKVRAIGGQCLIAIRGEVKKVKIIKTFAHFDREGKPAEILSFGKEGIIVGCGRGAVEILALQLEGKRAMHATEFTCGYQSADVHFLYGK